MSPTRTRRRVLAGAGTVVVAGMAVFAAGAGAPDPAPAPPKTDASARILPPPVKPAFTPGEPRRLAAAKDLSHWAPVDRAVRAHAAPDGAAPVVATLRKSTPEGTRNLVTVIRRRQDEQGEPWVEVRLPVLPNNSTGWVPRRALGGYETVRTRLDVDLDRLRATLYHDGKPVLHADIGVGTAGWDTPRGTFYVRNKLTRFRSATYGPIAFGTSARSPTATDWPAGGFVGIHGTDRPELLPGRVSHGCIRMRNPDILALAKRMPVGTPVVIH